MSRLVTNAIRSTAASSDAMTIDSAGKPSFPNGGVGKILQVKQTVKTDSASSTADNFTNIGPTVAITPSSNSNKVLVRFTFVGFGSNDNWSHYFRLARGGTGIGVQLMVLTEHWLVQLLIPMVVVVCLLYKHLLNF